MIIPNGTIEVLTTSDGGLNPTTGFPTKPKETWGAKIDCQFSPVRQDYLAKTVNSEPYSALSFSILIEAATFTGDRVRLSDRDGNSIGEFSVVSVEPLEAVGQVRITV